MGKQLKDVDIVVHIACMRAQSYQNLKNVDCLIGSLELAKAASKAQLTKFIGIGTCFEYETSNDALTIFTPLTNNPYGRQKPLYIYR